MTSNEEPRERLSELGNVYVTQTAAREYAAARGLPEETARRELTVLLLDAYKTSNGGWRRRIQARRVDVTAHVSLEGELAVVTATRTKTYLGGAEQRRARGTEDSNAGAYPTIEERLVLQTLPGAPSGAVTDDLPTLEAIGALVDTVRHTDIRDDVAPQQRNQLIGAVMVQGLARLGITAHRDGAH